MADNIEFSDEEDQVEEGGITIKNAAKYLNAKAPIPEIKKKQISNKVDEQKYFDAIARCAPNLEKAAYLKKSRIQFKSDFTKKYPGAFNDHDF